MNNKRDHTEVSNLQYNFKQLVVKRQIKFEGFGSVNFFKVQNFNKFQLSL